MIEAIFWILPTIILGMFNILSQKEMGTIVCLTFCYLFICIIQDDYNMKRKKALKR